MGATQDQPRPSPSWFYVEASFGHGRMSQAIRAARPTAKRPDGRVILALTPDAYEDAGVIAVDPDGTT